MKKYKAIIFTGILVAMTMIVAVLYLSTREEVKEGFLKIQVADSSHYVDTNQLTYEHVTGTRVNGKGEEKLVEGLGILLRDVLEEAGVTEYTKVTVVAADAYSAELTAEEIKETSNAYLLQEEEGLRLIVFGDKNSKRSISNVEQIVVE